ncbi:MAG: 2TM domain-containing protein [Chitinophagaceae bacterium]
MDSQKKDDLLWQMAKKRAAFKWSLAAYFFVNCFLIGVWYFTTGIGSYFWPIWPMLGWGIGIAFQYFDAYHGNRIFSAQEEYEKLKNKNQS